ncbi:MAG: ATP-binding cassette domain-containing protein, partial [Lachnospiraceae bacterium]|nr:ATP-binding cassette domain-containing protein [Lachnospiraceae bacterium]
MEFLKIEDLCKVYGKDENKVIALDHVSLNIEKGDFTAIIGTSGSGKSTLLHAIAGVDIPTSGKIYLDGQDVYAHSSENLAIFRRGQVVLI